MSDDKLEELLRSFALEEDEMVALMEKMKTLNDEISAQRRRLQEIRESIDNLIAGRLSALTGRAIGTYTR